MAMLIVDQTHQIVFHDIRHSQVHILVHRQIERVTGLVGIHDMAVVLQAYRVVNSIVERQIDIVGIIAENLTQVSAQGTGQLYICLCRQLRLNLGGHIGHQLQFVIYISLCTAITQVLVNDRATREDDRDSHPNKCSDYAPTLHITGQSH